MGNTKILTSSLQTLILLLFFPFQGFGLETDTINSTLSIKDPDSIVSPRRFFKLGFFSPVNTTNRYLGIFYVFSERDVIWVANRNNPLRDSSGTVTVSTDGNLVLKNGQNGTVWSTNAANATTNTTAEILDTGNLVLRDVSTGNVVWDSFTHPTNVFVPTMRTTDNIKTGEKRVLSSWKTESDPAVGNFTAGLEALKLPQNMIWENGRTHWRSGPWNGVIYIGIQNNNSPNLAGFTVGNDSETYYFTAPEMAYVMKVSLNSSGVLEHKVWNNQTKSWMTPWLAPENECDFYGKCGPFGICNVHDSPVCSCLRGFEPANRNEWRNGNWTSGCVRKTQLQCDRSNNSKGNGDGFLSLPFIKVPDFAERDSGRREEECRSLCLMNCSCIAYSHDPNLGCLFWTEKLIDILQFSGVGPDIYIRLASSELDDDKDNKLIIIIPVIAGFACISISAFLLWCWMAKRKGILGGKDRKISEAKQRLPSCSNAIVLKDDSEMLNIKDLPLFTFDAIADATNQFHNDNMLGTGGFGSVYLGKLENGKEIAIKRLSEASSQGVQEFMNEVILISKLQHRNLVRLIGCCVEKEEKMLIYEHMPNKSLDVCLFDPSHPSQKFLDWEKRLSIIEGIGLGLLYLHKDSILKIIHRDLKPSNILLDEEWNPKISDFGMARIFGGNEDQANTSRVVGTYGYMAPEYAMEGRFSEKSDIYSFGVLILEIVSGKKNTRYYNEDWSLSLLGCAWKLWNENNAMAFVNQMIGSSKFREEIVRYIHIALLCVQELPKDRPTIQTVLSMLSGEITYLPLPERPVFSEKWNPFHVGSTQFTSQMGYSVNELTVTALDGR